MFTLIKDNEIDHLNHAIFSHCNGESIAYLRWEGNQEEVLHLVDGSVVRVSDLSPLSVAIVKKSFGQVKNLVERFSGQGLREYY